MKVNVWNNFSKRINSTKRPADAGTEIECVLKSSTSFENPSFIFTGPNFEYNYLKWNNHYYYITDITILSNNRYEISCSQDILATYKSEIGSVKAFIQYSSSDYNKLIPDTRISITNDIIVNLRTQSFIPDMSGSYIIGVAGKDGSSGASALTGMICYYAVSAQTIKNITDDLYSDSVATQLRNYFKSPFDSLISAHWVPFTVTGGESTNIYLGDYATEYVGISLGHYAHNLQGSTYNIDIPWEYDDWRNCSPYTKIELWLPFYGTLQIPVEKLIHSDSFESSIRINTSFDAVSGSITYGVWTDSLINTITVDVGVTLAIGQTVTGAVKGLTEIGAGVGATVGAGVGIATGGASIPLTASLIGGITAIGHGVITGAWEQNNMSKGATGNFSISNLLKNYNRFGNIKLYVYTHNFSMEPNEINEIEGRPLYDIRTINSLSGYVRCQGASISIDGYMSDKESINSYLNSGFYYE